MKFDWGRLPLLLTAVTLLIGTAAAWLEAGEDPAAVALLAASLVLLGAWCALEVIAAHRRLHRGEGKEGDRDEG